MFLLRILYNDPERKNKWPPYDISEITTLTIFILKEKY